MKYITKKIKKQTALILFTKTVISGKLIDVNRAKSATLIEVMIVIIIIAILAAITVPLMRGFKARYIVAEAIAGLRHIAAAERAYYNKYGTFFYVSKIYTHPTAPMGTNIYDIPGIEEGDLNGIFYSEECYRVVWGADPDEPIFLAACCFWPSDNITPNEALRRDEARAIVNHASGYFLIELEAQDPARPHEYSIATANIPGSGYANSYVDP